MYYLPALCPRGQAKVAEGQNEGERRGVDYAAVS